MVRPDGGDRGGVLSATLPEVHELGKDLSRLKKGGTNLGHNFPKLRPIIFQARGIASPSA